MRIDRLLADNRWTELSKLFDPDPACSAESCVVEVLTRGMDCDAATGPIKLSFDKAFVHGDGFVAKAQVASCQFNVDVYYDYQLDKYYFPLLPRD